MSVLVRYPGGSKNDVKSLKTSVFKVFSPSIPPSIYRSRSYVNVANTRTLDIPDGVRTLKRHSLEH